MFSRRAMSKMLWRRLKMPAVSGSSEGGGGMDVAEQDEVESGSLDDPQGLAVMLEIATTDEAVLRMAPDRNMLVPGREEGPEPHLPLGHLAGFNSKVRWRNAPRRPGPA